MITLFVVFLALCIIALIALILTGIVAVCWPLAVILLIGIIIDSLVLKKLLHL